MHVVEVGSEARSAEMHINLAVDSRDSGHMACLALKKLLQHGTALAAWCEVITHSMHARP